jgi:DNA anti-recombination protein RmuC
MSKSYRQMGAMSKNIMASHQSQLKAIEQLRKETADQISHIAKERDKLNAYIFKIATDIAQSTDPIEKEKKQYTKESQEKSINNLDRLQSIWEGFDEIQDTLKEQLEAHSKQIGLLLHILEADAENYKQVAGVISLNESEIEALGNLPDLSKLLEVIENIKKGEAEILKQLDKIGKSDSLGD